MKTKFGVGKLALALIGMAVLVVNLRQAESTATAGENAGDELAAATAPDDQSAPATLAPAAPAPTPTNLPPRVQLSFDAGSVARLAQGGVSEEVMLAFVGTANGRFGLGADQIQYLSDLGVSTTLVKAMIQHDASLDAAWQSAAPIPPPPAPAVTDPVNPTDAMDPGANPLPGMDGQDNLDINSTADAADYFYDSLAPYGAWFNLGGYGYCWQPTVFASNRAWRPYGDRGRWLYTDSGWYWQSDYNWGWAAFHYGRWLYNGTYGWIWVPDKHWSPAWVSWRSSPDHAGWAPLPPSARFTPVGGFKYLGRPVGPGFEFGLRPADYTFVPIGRLNDYSPARYSVAADAVAEIYAGTVVRNDIAVKNGRLVHTSIDPALVAQASGSPVRKAGIQVLAVRGEPGQFDRVTKQGDSLVIYRPQLPPPSNQFRGTAKPAGGTITPVRTTGGFKGTLTEKPQSQTQIAGNVPQASSAANSGRNAEPVSARGQGQWAGASSNSTTTMPERPVRGVSMATQNSQPNSQPTRIDRIQTVRAVPAEAQPLITSRSLNLGAPSAQPRGGWNNVATQPSQSPAYTVLPGRFTVAAQIAPTPPAPVESRPAEHDPAHAPAGNEATPPHHEPVPEPHPAPPEQHPPHVEPHPAPAPAPANGSTKK